MKTTHNQIAVWERAKRMAFWDQGKLDYDHWLRAFKSGNANVIRQSIDYMRAADLIELIGKRQFIKAWPLLRCADELMKTKKSFWMPLGDGMWQEMFRSLCLLP